MQNCKTTTMKKRSEETQTLRAGSSKAETKIFAPPQTPVPEARYGQNLISWRWSVGWACWWDGIIHINFTQAWDWTQDLHVAVHPQYLVDCCKRTSDVYSHQRLRSANRCQLIVPRHRRSMFGRRAFSIVGPMEWNSLPDSLWDRADSFRSALKTHLFAALRDD